MFYVRTYKNTERTAFRLFQETQSEQLSALLETPESGGLAKRALHLALRMIHLTQELDITVIPSSQKYESIQNALENSQTGTQVRLIQDEIGPPTRTDAVNPRTQEKPSWKVIWRLHHPPTTQTTAMTLARRSVKHEGGTNGQLVTARL